MQLQVIITIGLFELSRWAYASNSSILSTYHTEVPFIDKEPSGII